MVKAGLNAGISGIFYLDFSSSTNIRPKMNQHPA